MPTPRTVLAVNPGSRYLGIAVLQGTQLRDWRVKVLRGRSTREKAGKAKYILLTLLQRYQPAALAIKKLDRCRSSRALNQLTQEISILAESNGAKVREYPLRRLERFFTGQRKSNKRAMAEILATEYPDLMYELDREKAAKNPYHIRLFEAVALAALCAHELDNN